MAFNHLALLRRKISVLEASFVEDCIEIGASGSCVDIDYFNGRLRSQHYGFGCEALMELIM